MQFLLDNVAAQIVTAGILLMLLTVSARSQRAVSEATHFAMMRKQQIGFVEFLKRDLHNLSEVVSVVEDSVSLEFTFHSRTDSASTTEHEITYRRVPAGEHDGVDLYRVERYQNGQYDGASMATLTTWVIEARNADGVGIADPANARQLYVRFEALNTYREAQTIDRARWEATFRPPSIQQNDTI